MEISWFSLLLGCALGLLPGYKLINSECRYCDFETLTRIMLERGEAARRRKRWWKLPLVWIDPIRGYVAAWLLFAAFSPTPEARGFMRLLPMLLEHALLFVAVVMQTLGRGKKDECISPAGFMFGVMLAMLKPVVAISALIIGASTAWAMSGYGAGYALMVLMTAGLGVVFQGANIGLAAKVCVSAAPLLSCWWRQCRFVTPLRC